MNRTGHQPLPSPLLRAEGRRPPTASALRSGRPMRCGRPSRRVVSVSAKSDPVAKKSGLGKYLSDAFMRIFSVPEDENISWEKTYLPFEGRLDIHDQRRLRRLYEVVQAVKGCTDPKAENYAPGATLDDGSCVYSPNDQAQRENLKNYLKGAVERVVGHQFKGEDTEPEYGITPFSGRILSQRETERLAAFRRVVKKTMKEASSEEKE